MVSSVDLKHRPVSHSRKADYAHVGDEDYQCSERTASSVVDLTGTDKSPAAATAVGDADCQHHDAERTASSVVYIRCSTTRTLGL